MSGTDIQIVTAEEAQALAGEATPSPWHWATAPHPDSPKTKAEYVAGALRDETSPLWTTWAADPDGGAEDYLIPALTGDGPAAEANARLCAAAPDLAHTVVKVSEERDWLVKALRDQEAAYAALEQQYLALVDQYGALIDQVTAALTGGKA